MALHYSKYLGVKHSQLVACGVYDGFLDHDSKLHIDPMLLKNSQIPEFLDAYKAFISYFDRFYALQPYVINRSVKKDRFFSSMVTHFTFPEIPNTGLGYSEKRVGGNGISGKIAENLANSSCDIIGAGIQDREIFALMHFLEDGIGADRISDMSIHILSAKFLAYTARVSEELHIETQHYEYKGTTYDVPFYNGNPIYFIPESFLTDLKMARDVTDIDYVASYNSTLRHKVCAAIQGNWEDFEKLSKSEFREVVYRNRVALNELLAYVRDMRTCGYDFRQDHNEEYDNMVLEEILQDHPLDLNVPLQEGNEADYVFELTRKICYHFKYLVENCRMYRIMLEKGGSYKRETDWQHLLFVVASSYLEGGRYDIDLSAEADEGAGELDFKLSHGAFAKTVVEMKLSDNSNLLHGYVTQLPKYLNAERGDHGLFVVILIDNEEKGQMQTLRNKKINFEETNEIIFVDAKPKVSASLQS